VEACHLARIHPHHRWCDLNPKRKQNLAGAIQAMLEVSMKRSDHEHWRVFQKKGEPCGFCGDPILYAKDGGGSGKRGSYFCSACQPLPLAAA
jgi:formamidopyrimidine-DNA glycosylase